MSQPDQEGRRLESWVVGLLRFAPRLARTYFTIAAHPRQYFQSLREPRQSASLVSPATFWVVNTAIVKALSALSTEGEKPWSLSSASDYGALLAGIMLYPCFLVGILGIRGWQNLRRMLRIVFSCSVLFIPLYVVSSIPPDDVLSQYLDSVFQGTTTAISWYHVAALLLALGTFLGWFALVGFGIRQVFRRTKLSIGLSLLAVVSVEFTLFYAFLVFYGAPTALKEVRRIAQLFGPARTALIRTPPDYDRAAESFRSMYAGRGLQLKRRYRLGARIGRTAAELAYSAVMFKQPALEKKLYDCQMQVLAEDNQGAGVLLFEATEGIKSTKDPLAKMMITRKCEAELDTIRKMLADPSYDPDTKSSSASAKSRASIPFPTPFP